MYRLHKYTCGASWVRGGPAAPRRASLSWRGCRASLLGAWGIRQSCTYKTVRALTELLAKVDERIEALTSITRKVFVPKYYTADSPANMAHIRQSRSSKSCTYKTVKARIWPWLSDKKPSRGVDGSAGEGRRTDRGPHVHRAEAFLISTRGGFTRRLRGSAIQPTLHI